MMVNNLFNFNVFIIKKLHPAATFLCKYPLKF
jgi:hypothetical protein